MRIIVIVAVLLPRTVFPGESEWSLHLRTLGPWGKRLGVYVDSDRSVGRAPGFKKEDIQVCQALSLYEDEVNRFAMLIAGIPKEIPSRSILELPTNCMNVNENSLTFKAGSTVRHFRYTQDNDCLRDIDVPSWLPWMVEVLWIKYEKIWDCEPNVYKGVEGDTEQGYSIPAVSLYQ